MIDTHGVTMRGFGEVFVRASTSSRARMLCAASFADAGWGTLAEGLEAIECTRIAPEEDDRELCRPKDGPEGVCVSDEVAAGQRRHREFLERRTRATEYIAACVRTARRASDLEVPYSEVLVLVPADATEVWHVINTAILERWSPRTLNGIKRKAWSLVPAHIATQRVGEVGQHMLKRLEEMQGATAKRE